MKQVRIDDDIADWLAAQGGSVSAAANRTLAWAMDVIEAGTYDDATDEVAPVPDTRMTVDRPVDSHDPPRAGKTLTSTRAARRTPSFSPIIRRP